MASCDWLSDVEVVALLYIRFSALPTSEMEIMEIMSKRACFGLSAFISLLAIASALQPVFFESFDKTWEGRWIPSKKDKYTGIWKHSKSEGHEDYGLLVSEPARRYGLAVGLSETLKFTGETVVLQYEVRLHKGLECGGAYLKFLPPQGAGWSPSEFSDETPYSIMFGPDKCGYTNRVHFIFNHKSLKTGEMIEHQLDETPLILNDTLSHVYTAVIYPNNTLTIAIDGEVKRTADLLSNDFDPSVLIDPTIPDPDDLKPDDWDEQDMIDDPNAVKPSDWDEDAPYDIEDEEAVKPEGWLDHEPAELVDPDSKKPDDWDEDQYGDWEPAKIPNPKCAEAPGCGPWIRPTKPNPNYRGPWFPPQIDNPNYKGLWKPAEIPNPEYIHLDRPNFEPIGAIGIEIWTMQDGILFDNILVTRDESFAQQYREKYWRPKFDSEKKRLIKVENKAAPASTGHAKATKTTAVTGLSGWQGKVFEVFYRTAELPFLSTYKGKLIELIVKAEERANLMICVVGATIFLIFSIIFRLVRGSKEEPGEITLEHAKKHDISSSDDKKLKSTEKGRTKASVEKIKDGGAKSEGAGPKSRKNPRRET